MMSASSGKKTRVDPDNLQPLREEYLGAAAALRDVHPVPTLSAESCTEQRGVVGSWADRLPHFRMDAVPASGAEIQSEYMVARRHAVDALRAIRDLSPLFRPHLWISEVRSVAADDLWMSTAYGTDTICIHFSFRLEPEVVSRLLPIVELALDPFAPRPHWGKQFVATAKDLAPRYEHFADFRHLAERLDQRGAFRNAFLDRHVFG